jgi:hypothetical protein
MLTFQFHLNQMSDKLDLQGRPFREGIRENSALWYGLVGASTVAVSGATDLIPELNRWLQIVEMTDYVCLLLSSKAFFELKLMSLAVQDPTYPCHGC